MDVLKYVIKDPVSGEQLIITNCPQIQSSVIEFMEEPPFTVKWEDDNFEGVCESYRKEAKTIFGLAEFTEHYEVVGAYEEAA